MKFGVILSCTVMCSSAEESHARFTKLFSLIRLDSLQCEKDCRQSASSEAEDWHETSAERSCVTDSHGSVMFGEGEYNKASQSQAESLKLVLNGLLEDMKTWKGKVSEVARLRVADYGCSQGKSSLPIVSAVIAAGESTPIDFFFTDLPQNDWDSARLLLQSLGHVEPADKASFHSPALLQPFVDDAKAGNHSVRMLMCGRSFYEQVIPSNSIDLGFSGTAMHWVSHAPKGSGFFFGGDLYFRKLERSNPMRLEWENLAAKDWESNLRSRSEELVSGGSLHFVVPVFDPESRPSYTYQKLADVIMETLQTLLRRGEISQKEADAFVTPVFLRSREEFEAPFQAGAFEGLVLESFSTHLLPSPYWQTSQHDPARFADSYVRSVRAWSYNSWTSKLAAVSHQADTIVEKLYRAINEGIMKNPQDFRRDYVQAYMTLRKL
ncbi:Anthranilate O-methyltransferase 2 [Symbiodinium microadriaticum]|uniref:Anthranilate O-methyltransferase 2 n=1 Tax=Symbiodinium microadriaticum TaxID=2951 RepID=A0A1Q9DJK3_SYMMI|nr:Anthranilate O-methyltransferase 2 [Symbiodinium microadriaticum]